MTKKEFKNLYEKFERSWQISEENFKNFTTIWETYYGLIQNENLKLDSEDKNDYTWLKKSSDDRNYLPGFFEMNKDKFGGGRCGNFTHYMIYHDSKKGFYDGYVKIEDPKKKDTDCYKNEKEQLTKIDEHYKIIKQLLSGIVEAKYICKLQEIEKEQQFKEFKAKQVLRKLVVLHFALDEDVIETNSLLWIYDEKVIDNLVDIFEFSEDAEPKISGDSTFFEKSNAVWKWTVECCEDLADYKNGVIKDKDAYNRFAKLNNLLWELGKSNAVDLTNFNVPNIIYHGAPGTGKTYTTLQTVKLLCQGDNSRYKYCQFHPSYSYQDFIEGIKPMGITENGNVQLEVVNGIFKQFCIEVKKKNETFYKGFKNDNEGNAPKIDDYPHYYFIVDEINRGDLSRIFGETFSLLEADYRDKDFSNPTDGYKNDENLIVTPLSNVIEQKINNKKEKKPDNTIRDNDLAYKTIGGKVYFGIPFNIHFIGLMNDVDKSIDTFDLALRRRFKWITKKCDYDVISDKIDDVNSNLETEDYIKKCNALNDFIIDKEKGLGLSKNYQLGQSYFMKIVNVLSSKSKTITETARKSVFENYIETTLREYAREVCDENEIDDKINGAKIKFGIKEDKNTNNDEQ